MIQRTGPSGDGPLILAFDTALPHCAAALCQGRILAETTEEMARGQAERLMPLLENLLRDQGVTWQDIELLAVGIGPGNFTGIRIAVSAARGLGLGLGIPVMGVSMFEVMRDPQDPLAHPSEIVSLPAPRDQVYLQQFRHGQPADAPVVVDLQAPPVDLRFSPDTRVIGHAAQSICQVGQAGDWDEQVLTDVAARIAQRAQARFLAGDTNPDRPAPLYVRAADAAEPRDKAPEVLP